MDRRTVIVSTLSGDTESAHSSRVTLRRFPWDKDQVAKMTDRPETDPPRGVISRPHDARVSSDEGRV